MMGEMTRKLQPLQEWAALSTIPPLTLHIRELSLHRPKLPALKIFPFGDYHKQECLPFFLNLFIFFLDFAYFYAWNVPYLFVLVLKNLQYFISSMDMIFPIVFLNSEGNRSKC